MAANAASLWPQARSTLAIPVRFAETDLMGVVHHSAYVVWFEAGRVAWMDAAGMPYPEIAGMGHHFAVTGIQAAYRAAARFGDVVEVVTWLAQLRSRQVAFQYEVRRRAADDAATVESSELLATGRSDHICVDLDGRMAKIPPVVVERLQRGAEQLAARAA